MKIVNIDTRENVLNSISYLFYTIIYMIFFYYLHDSMVPV